MRSGDVTLTDFFTRKDLFVQRNNAKSPLDLLVENLEVLDVLRNIPLSHDIANFLKALIATDAFWLRHLNPRMRQQIVSRQSSLTNFIIFQSFPEARESSRFIGKEGKAFLKFLQTQLLTEAVPYSQNNYKVVLLHSEITNYEASTLYIKYDNFFKRLHYICLSGKPGLHFDKIEGDELLQIIPFHALDSLEPFAIDKINPYLNKIFQITNARGHTNQTANIRYATLRECLLVLSLLWNGHLYFLEYIFQNRQDQNYSLAAANFSQEDAFTLLQLRGLLYGFSWDFITSSHFNNFRLQIMNMMYCNLKRHEVEAMSVNLLRKNLTNVIEKIPQEFQPYLKLNQSIIVALKMGYPYDAIFKFNSLDIGNIKQSIIDNLLAHIEKLCETILIATSESRNALHKEIKDLIILIMHFTNSVTDNNHYKLAEIVDQLNILTAAYDQFIALHAIDDEKSKFEFEARSLKNFIKTLRHNMPGRISSNTYARLEADEVGFESEEDEESNNSQADAKEEAESADWGDLEELDYSAHERDKFAGPPGGAPTGANESDEEEAIVEPTVPSSTSSSVYLVSGLAFFNSAIPEQTDVINPTYSSTAATPAARG